MGVPVTSLLAAPHPPPPLGPQVEDLHSAWSLIQPSARTAPCPHPCSLPSKSLTWLSSLRSGVCVLHVSVGRGEFQQEPRSRRRRGDTALSRLTDTVSGVLPITPSGKVVFTLFVGWSSVTCAHVRVNGDQRTPESWPFLFWFLSLYIKS